METLLPAAERGHTNAGWLDSHHTFSFGEHYDPSRLGFRALRVINDDRVEGGEGFGPHPHRDMEIITYVLAGSLAHKDSLGTGSVIRRGEVQRMSAGTGVVHSEFNASRDETVHFLQIWILPEKKGLTPSYEQKRFEPESRRHGLRLIASRDGREGSVVVHQDVELRAALLASGESAAHPLAKGRHAFVHVVEGEVTVNGQAAQTGDGLELSEVERVTITARGAAEVLLFDLA